MSDNVVEILVKSRDTAKPDMADLRAKLADLDHQVATARANVDDEEAAAKLDKLQAQLLELGKRTANPKITMSGAIRAEAQIHAIDASLKNLSDSSDKTTGRLGALGQALNTLVLGGLSGGVGEMNAFGKAMMAANVATGIGEPLMAGLTVAAGGMASGLAAAASGLGAFGLVAKSNFSAAAAAANATSAAQTRYQASVTAANAAYQRQMSTATTAAQRQQAATAKASALQSAYKSQVQATTAAYANLTPAQVGLAKSIGSMQNQWQSFTASFAPMLSQILGQFQPVFGTVLGDIGKLATAGGNAIQALLPQLGMAIKSSGFQSFIQMLADNAGPAIVKIGVAIGHVATGIGGILRAFMPMSQAVLSGLDSITAKFAQWGATLSQHSGFQSLMAQFRSETPQAEQVLKNLATVIANVARAMAGLSTASNSKTLLQMLVPLTGVLASLSKNQDLDRIALYLLSAVEAGKKLKVAFTGISDGLKVLKTGAGMLQDFRAGFTSAAAAASDATGIWGTFGGKIGDAIAAIKSWSIWSKLAAAATRIWTGIQAAFDAVMDANPIMLVVVAIAALVAGVVLAYQHFAGFRDLVKRVFHDVTAAVSDAVSWIRGHWPMLLGILTGPIGMATVFIVQHWHQILSGAQAMVSDVVSFFESLPGRILGALGDLGSLLWNAGASIIHGLLSGLESAWNDVAGWVSNVAGWIANLKGPLPKDRRLLVPHGQAIMDGLVSGLDSRMPRLTAQMGRTTAAITGMGGHGTAGLAGGRGPGQLRVQLEWAGGSDDPLFQLIRHGVRIRGGNVQTVLGWGT